MHRIWISAAGGVLGGCAAGFIGWQLAGNDIQHVGDWRIGGARFIGFLIVLGIAIGFLLARRLVSGKPHTSDGYLLSYSRIAPKTEGYREGAKVTVADLVAALATYGYEPIVTACDETGEPRGAIELDTPLAGANIGIRDPQVKGWVRLQLASESADAKRRMGLLDTWTHRGESADELALFTLRALDQLAGDLTAARRASQLGQDPASLLTAGLGDTPVHRDGLARLGANR
ncbi:hypothetical protein BH11MYX1_BH11MYX1_54800 [soil metagenome]